MTMITPSYLGETIEYSSLHACRSTLEDPTRLAADGIAIDPEVFPGRPVPQLYLDIDRTKAKTLGVSLSDVANTLQVFAGKDAVSNFNEFGRTSQVKIQPGAVRGNAEDLTKLQVRNDQGQMVRLGTIVTVRDVDAAPAALRVDLYPAFKITAAVPDGKSVAEVAAKCVKIAEDEKPGKGYKVFDLSAAKPR